MRELTQSRKTRYTQTVLRDSLIELMREKPVSKITIKELCEKADINRSTFYAHYADQYDLLKSMEDETLQWVEEIIKSFSGKTDKKAVIANFKKMFEYISENSNHIQVLMSEQGDIGFQRNLLSTIYTHCGIWLAGNIEADAGRELRFVYLVNGTLGLIQHWLRNGLKEDSDEMSAIIYSMTFGFR